ncbi:mucoidy inhibitor MuiA family protein [bacterium]|nr:mucoidy inhibitor MuiA family protein [bacterium]
MPAQETITPLILESIIESVTLFTNQAQVTRKAKTTLKKGLQEILIDIEACNVDGDSVSAKIFGEGEIYSVQYREVYLPEAPQENIRKLDEQIEEKGTVLRRLEKSRNVIDQRDAFLHSVVHFSQSEIPKDLKTAMPGANQLEETLVFLEKNANASNEKRQELEIQMAALNKELTALGHARESLCSQGDHSKRVIEVLFNAAKEQTIELEASYIVYDAGWQPFYKINVPNDLKKPTLTMFSRIVQQTGEDWLAAKLAISNVIPMQGIGLPDIHSWILDVYRQQLAPSMDRAARRKEKKSMDYDDEMDAAECCEPAPAMSAPAPQAEFLETEKTELPLAFEYSLPQALDIESQDKETILPLLTKSVPGDFFYRVVPQANTLAFLVCRSQADSELLSGYLNVHFGSRYIGKTYLPDKKPGEDFQFSLGADRQIKVKRESKKDKVKETLLGMVQRQSIVRELSFTITLENLKDRTVQLEVLDTIPVSRTDKIEVKDVDINPKPQTKKHQDREGVLQWLIDLAPGEKKEITLNFTVVYPKNPGIMGL